MWKNHADCWCFLTQTELQYYQRFLKAFIMQKYDTRLQDMAI
jgi:hypothetical protein